MAFQHFPNVVIRGITASVPAKTFGNREWSGFESPEAAEKFIDTTGVARRHSVEGSGLRTSDMSFDAADRLIHALQWERQEIDCLIFVSQTADYIFPATACLLQDRLGLPKTTMAFDVSLGCSGWVYGASVLAALLNAGQFKKGLLLAGDTSTMTKSPKDKSSYPLFGDAGTATAMEYCPGNTGIFAETGTDGAKAESIIVKGGGFREFYRPDSLEMKVDEDGVERNHLHTHLDGPGVFIFGITEAPRSIRSLVERAGQNLEQIDFLLLHQANKMMNEKIRQKLKLPEEKVPYSLHEYGNTSSSSIPLTITSQLSEKLQNGKHRLLSCGFGVGLSWGTLYWESDDLVCPPLHSLPSP